MAEAINITISGFLVRCSIIHSVFNTGQGASSLYIKYIKQSTFVNVTPC